MHLLLLHFTPAKTKLYQLQEPLAILHCDKLLSLPLHFTLCNIGRA